MADLVSPRRGESIIDADGVPTLRFFEYLEANTSQANESLVNTAVDSSAINLSTSQIGTLIQRLDDMDIEIGIILAEPGRV